jgi:acyl-CoA thioesterase
MNEAEALAQRCADALWQDDVASQALGMTLHHVAPGLARMSMLVRTDMVNGHGLCHGGFIFTLADSTAAFAAGSHGERAVAQHATITYIRPVRSGEILIADAEERSRSGRSGIYDIHVTGSSDGTVVAEIRVHTRLSGRRFFTEGA